MKQGDIVKTFTRDFILYGKVLEVKKNSTVIKWNHPAFPKPVEIFDASDIKVHWSKKDQDKYHLQQLKNLISKL